MQENSDEVYDVLATIKASQQRQETNNVVNYIIDSDFIDLEPAAGEEDVKANEEGLIQDTANPSNNVQQHLPEESESSSNTDEATLLLLQQNSASKKAHRRTDSSAIDWQALNKKMAFAQEDEVAAEENIAEPQEENGSGELCIDPEIIPDYQDEDHADNYEKEEDVYQHHEEILDNGDDVNHEVEIAEVKIAEANNAGSEQEILQGREESDSCAGNIARIES